MKLQRFESETDRRVSSNSDVLFPQMPTGISLFDVGSSVDV